MFLRIVQADFKVKWSFWLAVDSLFFLRLLHEELDRTCRSWLELDNVVLFVVDHVEISKVELSSSELSLELNSVQVIGEVCPTALLVEDSGLESVLGEVLRSCC